MWIVDAVLTIEQRVCHIVFPVVGVLVAQPPWIHTQKGVMRPKEWSTLVGVHPVFERQGRIIRSGLYGYGSATGPAFMVDLRIDGESGRGGGEDIGDHALVIAGDLMIHGPLLIGRPVPVKHLFTPFG